MLNHPAKAKLLDKAKNAGMKTTTGLRKFHKHRLHEMVQKLGIVGCS
jgi:hypothetical protein